MGTCEETEVKNGQQIYALGYNEKDPTEFGFCRYVGTQLAANKAYLVFTQKYILKEYDLQPGQYTFVLATEKDANNQPQGIAWGTYNSSNKRINKTNISDTATPTEWQFQVTDDNLVTIENGSYKLAVLKEYGESSLYDYNRQNTKSDYLDDWTLTSQPETSKFKIGVSQFPDRSISLTMFMVTLNFTSVQRTIHIRTSIFLKSISNQVQAQWLQPHSSPFHYQKYLDSLSLLLKKIILKVFTRLMDASAQTHKKDII